MVNSRLCFEEIINRTKKIVKHTCKNTKTSPIRIFVVKNGVVSAAVPEQQKQQQQQRQMKKQQKKVRRQNVEDNNKRWAHAPSNCRWEGVNSATTTRNNLATPVLEMLHQLGNHVHTRK